MSLRLQRLEVRNFGCVRRAELELAPGLNVLHGPNDLGKSTLAAALRAVLLLPCSSTAARAYVPWHEPGQHPSVTLELTAGNGPRRVEKVWASGRAAAARLLDWEDGQWRLVEQGRAVDALVRSMLQWGIPEPGGRGGPVGLPESFLATALLGAQQDPARIFREQLGRDPDPSGRQRLVDALGVLAQDPTVERIGRDIAAKVDLAFTPKRQRKSGREAIWTKLDEEIEQLRRSWRELDEQVRQSDEVVRHLHDARQRVHALRTREESSRIRVEHLTTAFEQHRRRAELQAAHDEIALALARVEQLRAEQQVRFREREQCLQAMPALVERQQVAAEALRTGEAELAAAVQAQSDLEASLRGEHEHAERELQMRLQLLAEDERRHQETIRSVERARQHASACLRLEAELEQARAEHERASQQLRDAQTQLQALDRQLEALEQTVSATRLREELTRAREAARELERARALRKEAKLRREALQVVPKLERGALDAMLACSDDLRLARARLRGAVSVTLAPIPGVELEFSRDGSSWERIVTSQELEVDAGLQLRIGGSTFATIYAGEAEARDTVVRLQRRYDSEFAPLLLHFGAADVRELARRYEAELEEQARALELEREAAALETRAKSGRGDLGAAQQAGLEQRVARLEAQSQLELGLQEVLSLDDLESQQFALRAQRAQLAEALDRMRQRSTAAQTACVRVEERLTSQRQVVADASGSSGTTDDELVAAREALRVVVEARAAVEHHRRTRTLEHERRRAAALSRVSAAQERLRGLVVSHGECQSRLEQCKSQLDKTEATLEHIAAALLQVDEAPLRARVAELADRLRVLPEVRHELANVDAATLEERLEHARREHAAARDDLEAAQAVLAQYEGALSHVGGDVLRERAQQLEEAIAAAQAERADVELEYEAWRLLETTFQEAQQEQDRHLGRLLGRTVGERFAALTAGRYGDVSLTKELGMAGISTQGELRDAAAFSEGCKEQLATLLRVGIAEQLDSVLVLDDHLAQTDGTRVAWFRELLDSLGKRLQIVVLTCRPHEYLDGLSASDVHAVDLRERIERYAG